MSKKHNKEATEFAEGFDDQSSESPKVKAETFKTKSINFYVKNNFSYKNTKYLKDALVNNKDLNTMRSEGLDLDRYLIKK